MSGLGLSQVEERQLLQQATPGNGEDAGFLSGVTTAIPEGVASGAVRGVAPLAAGTVDEGSNPLLGALGGGLPEQYMPEKPGASLTDQQFEAQRNAALAKTFEAFRPDPRTTGFAGQLLFGVADLGSRFVAGSALGGPLGGATVAGVSEGYAATAEQIAAGVDSDTAKQVGTIQGATAAIGGLLPVGIGTSTVAKVVSGAALNVGLGVVSRGATSELLVANGYEKQAQQYKWLDATALITDAVLGAGFGYAASPHAKALGERLFAETRPTPEQIDAAAVANQQNHAEIQTAPGVTVDDLSRDAHIDNLVRSSEALMADEPVPSLRDVSVIENPEARQFRNEIQRAASEPLDRRTDMETRARIEDMSPEQQVAEIRWLREENQRLTNEHATDPLTGLGNKVAWARIEQDASLPVKAMLDVDSLKWVNDNLGHEAGDSYLVQVGEAIKRAGAEHAVRLSGDEFAFASRTPEAADALSARINEELGRVRVEATTPDGQVITKTGAGISYGRGATRREADANLYRNKQDRTTQGLRSDRGAEPTGVTRESAKAGAAMVSEMQFRPESIDLAVSRMMDSDAEVFGLRVDEGVNLRNGEGFPVSRIWEDSTPTDRTLDGTSSIRLKSLSAKGIQDALKELSKGGYYGDSVYLIGGDSRGSGADAGEVIVRNAKVISRIERSDAAGISRQPATGQQGEIPAARSGTEPASARPPDDGQPINAEARAANDVGAAAVDESATAVLAEQPDLTIVLEDGTVVRADAALAEADAAVAQAQADAKLYDVAVSCFLGNGL